MAGHAPVIAAALAGAADWQQLAVAWDALNPGLLAKEATPPGGGGGSTPKRKRRHRQSGQAVRAEQVLLAAATAAIAAALALVLLALWTAAWNLGAAAAWQLLGGSPRDIPGLDDFLRTARADLQKVAMHRAQALAAILANADGMTVAQLAAALAGAAGSLSVAEMIAWSELARGQWAAALAVYRDQAVMVAEWEIIDDGKACQACMVNWLAGTRLVGEAYPSGHAWPPAHPRCRCALLPVGVSVAAASRAG